MGKVPLVPVGGPEGPELDEIPPDVPEVDALERARPLAEAPNGTLNLRPDVPEADALDQEAASRRGRRRRLALTAPWARPRSATS